MAMLVRLAWRNLWRNTRRTVLTLLAVFFACFISVVQRGIDVGNDGANIIYTVNMFPGAMQIQRNGYLDAPSLRKSFPFSPGRLDEIKRISGVKGAAPRIEGNGLVALGSRSLGIGIFGIDPSRERETSTMPARFRTDGATDTPTRGTIIAGTTLLDNLDAAIGDTVVLLAQGFDGSLGNVKYRIAGTFKMGSPDFDASAVFMHLEDAQELFGMENRVTSIAVTVRDFDDVYEIRESVRTAVAADTSLCVPAWDAVVPDVKQAAELNQLGGKLFLSILIMIVAFGILNTILMSVTERFREFGVLLAVGMPNTRLAVVVLIETMLILAIGVAVAMAAGYGVNWYIMTHPIRITGDMVAAFEQYGYQPQIVSTVRWSVFREILFLITVISLTLASYPIWRVFRLEALKGIRHT